MSDAYCTNAASMLHVPSMHTYAGCMHSALPFHMSYTLHACDIHPARAHPKHAIHMSQTCRTHSDVHHILATHISYLGCTFSKCTHSCMHRHTRVHARMPQACCTYTACTHNVPICMLHANNTQAAHMQRSPASQMPHMPHTRKCCRHAEDAHCVHVNHIPHSLLHISHSH
jgi:hypothetical protein